ncbi:MAG: hypothetical protein ACYCWC_06245 [Rhodocyclaceae bacterium]
MASAARSSSAEADERLAAYLAPSVVADDLPGLFPLMQHQHLLAAFGALFHGSLAAAQIRLLVLREIGQRSDAPRWSRREIDAHFAYLDPAKLDTVVKRLAEHELLLWDSEDRTYRVSSLGHGALAALSALMQFADGEDAGLGFLAAQLAGGAAAGRIAQDHLAQMLARLTELEEDFAAAVRSGSELQLVAAQERWQSVFLWMEKGTEAIRTLTRDDLLDAAGWRLAQEIGQRQSRLMRMTGVFGRELAAMARQRVHLSQGGLSSTELAAWLKTRMPDTLAAFAASAIAFVPEPLFVTTDVLLDVAETELLREKVGAGETALPAPAEVAETRDFAAPLPPQLPALVALMAGLTERTSVADAVVAEGWRESAYRFSLLPLIGETTDDPTLADLAGLPLTIAATGEDLQTVARHGVEMIEDLHLEPEHG